MGNITVIGTGWSRGQLTLEAIELLRSGARILLHTERCGCAGWLREQGIAFESLDALYDSCEDFDDHARQAARAVLAAAKDVDVIYGVADVRDRSAAALVALQSGVRVIAGPPCEGALLACAVGETRCVEASDWESAHFTARENCLIREIDSRELAAEIKLKLMDVYPEASNIWLLNADESPRVMPLFEMDRADRYDHRTCALVPAWSEITRLERYDFEHLNEIMRILCAPDGCPWDRAQTHRSLRTHMLEEAYEVMDAIDEDDPAHLYDELGDMLLQIALHAELARRHGEFDISDVTTAICEKMIYRHSHVFGRDSAENPDQVLDLWSRNKMAERGQTTHTEVLKSVTRTLPAQLRAVKVLKRSADVGLCETKLDRALAICVEKIRALPGADDGEAVLGAALLALADAARLMKIDPEIALNGAVNRFIARFEAVEAEIHKKGGDIEALGPNCLMKYWDSVKL